MKNKRKKKILKLAKGFRNARSTKYKQAKQGVIRAGQHSFAHRRKKKRVMRKEWQINISYAVQALQPGLSYSRFMDMVTKKEVSVDRKIMSQMIKQNPEAFGRFVEEVTGEKNTGEIPAMTPVAEKAPKADKKEASEAKTEKAAPKKEKKAETPAKEEKSETKKTDSDDLTKVEGIGPKIAETLTAAGVSTFAELAKTDSEKIQEIITDVRGSHDSTTWPKQAGMAAEGKWDELKAWQDEMDGGKEG